ncbi:sepiapterin reductase (L-erythro-7,8-dihydrobiopterin forming) [Synchytrium endobioticum]|uniref:Sepiapterin reductase n=1 Tax=Synchytrium endobioticum TaxID=286115 RepID=A0A507D6H1_9FUNG|nr:sepiapterin reductase (L-erythro-7,8-dihydrobiopterin forming) [Synchytrium endobioticum]
MTTLIVVTGASRGLGRALSIALSEELGDFSSLEFMLIARDADGTKETQSLILEKRPHATIRLQQTDLGALDTLEDSLDEMFHGIIHPPSMYEKVYLFHNAGSLGRLDRIEALTLHDVQHAINLNVTSFMAMTSTFLRHFIECKHVRIINVSSLAAVQEFDTWSVYCSGKAARDAFIRTLVHEASIREGAASTRLKALNYAPGPLDTDMQRQARQSMPDVPLRKHYDDMHSQRALIDPSVSAKKLIKLLLEDDFKNGSHIDFYDIA